MKNQAWSSASLAMKSLADPALKSWIFPSGQQGLDFLPQSSPGVGSGLEVMRVGCMGLLMLMAMAVMADDLPLSAQVG